MKTQNTAHSNPGFIKPLLMHYTPNTKIQEEYEDYASRYDERRQIAYNMRTLGTRCLKTSSTRKKSGSMGYATAVDRKNAIDDTKTVK